MARIDFHTIILKTSDHVNFFTVSGSYLVPTTLYPREANPAHLLGKQMLYPLSQGLSVNKKGVLGQGYDRGLSSERFEIRLILKHISGNTIVARWLFK